MLTTSVEGGVDSPVEDYLNYLESKLKHGDLKVVVLPLSEKFACKFYRKEISSVFLRLVELVYSYSLDVVMAKVPFSPSVYVQVSMSIGQIITDILSDIQSNGESSYYLSHEDYRNVKGMVLLVKGILFALYSYEFELDSYKTPSSKFSFRLVLSNGLEPNIYLSSKNYSSIMLVWKIILINCLVY